MLRTVVGFSCAAALCFARITSAAPVQMYLVDAAGNGKLVGTVTISKAECGVMFKPDLQDLPPGAHGFHIHEKASCADKGMAAGPHLDPDTTEKHEGPYQTGHLGDLPVLVVAPNGKATLPVLAPRLTLEALKDRALVIHAHSDNYSDKPEKLGGGGDRIACGLIK